ncbi:DUF6443 domain-containing protein [Cloacibacterium sp.]|uniref:DUF6443 domain-containing protein n=1 Tax=Cloacibacterium sp. TaxID=1913682 RepID=UPI0039E51AD1
MKLYHIFNGIIVLLLGTGFSHGQLTSSENYIYSKTHLSKQDDNPQKSLETVQYFDGLNRPKQIINIKASPAQKDVVTHIEYDKFGRQIKDYLSVPQTGSQTGNIYSNPLSNATNVYGAEKIYAEKILESSPLDRVIGQKQVGNDWNSKPIFFSFDANTASDTVKKYVTTTSWVSGATSSTIVQNGSYLPNQLYKNTVTDEDGNTSIEFKNVQGQTILVRKVLSSTENADTYYIYNEYNQLAFVIPPLASVSSSIPLDELCYQYKYDGKNRLVEKKLPGKGWEYMVYDKQDRLVLTQDAMLRGTTNNFAKKGWLFTKYDKFGRIVYTGFFSNTASRETMQTSLNSMAANPGNNETRSGTGFTQNGLTVYYTKTAFPTGSMTILSVNYYDQYPSDLVTVPTDIQGETILTSQTTELLNTLSLPLAKFIKNIDADSWTKSYTFYDLKARAIGTHSYNYLGGYTKTESKLDFSGVPTETYTYHKRLYTDTEIVIKERFEYDNQNRLVKHWHNINNAANDELLTFNEYNELGQLKNKKVGGTATTSLQTVDYRYNVRGWMTQINDPSNLGTDLFGYKVKYNDPANATVAPAKYNGNISEIDWITNTDNSLRRYGYIYDNLNRLNVATYQKPDASVPETHSYDESIYYDLNGNILTLQRNGTTDGVAGTQIDDLEYYYTGNQLSQVIDGSSNYDGYPDTSGNTITYDVNGNMTSLLDKEIKTISYNFLNLPNKITFTGVIGRTTTNINTVNNYRADGVKIKKAHEFPNLSGSIVTKTTDYLDGFQYETVNTGATELQFVPTVEGYYDFTKNLYIYNYLDHLGNVRLSYADSNKNGIIDPSTEIIEENNYYPFGLKHEGYNNLAGNPAYKYKYNGKELQETGMYDYGARFYMPDIGRWGVQDKKSEAYYNYSQYQYVLNNPVVNIDIKGEWTVTIHYNMTYNALSKAGIGKKQADLISHYASVYADNPGFYVLLNNAVHNNKMRYRNDIDYSYTKESQVTDYYGKGTNHNIWHSMRSEWEKDNGFSASDAVLRGMHFGWGKIFESAKSGKKLDGLEKNSKEIQSFGQGIHALQDAYAHNGVTMDDHSAKNDRFGDTTEAQNITKSAVSVYNLMTENWSAINSSGLYVNSSGMDKNQWTQVLVQIQKYLNQEKESKK